MAFNELKLIGSHAEIMKVDQVQSIHFQLKLLFHEILRYRPNGAQEHPYNKLKEQNVFGTAFMMLFCYSGATWIALGWLHEELDAEDPSRFSTSPIKPLHLRLTTPSGHTIKERP